MRVLATLIGSGWLFLLWIGTRSRYHALRAWYRHSQSSPLLGAVLQARPFGPLASLAEDAAFARAHATQPRLSTRAIAQYSDDALMGYGDEVWTKGGATLETQQRGLILPLVHAVLGGSSGLRVVEIGTGNGDVIAAIAHQYPQHHCAGVDFSVTTARRVHPEVAFCEGYALDLALPADVVLLSSTAVVCTPAEWQAYCRRWRASGVQHVLLNEPTWGGYRQDPTGPVWSHHLEGACWLHQYGASLRAAGYVLRQHETHPYQHPVSARPDIVLVRLWATLV